VLSIIGDIHGDYKWYQETVANLESSVQVGDFGFDYSSVMRESSHKILGGNHDNYDMYYACPNTLGDFGYRVIGGTEIYFVRGACSIDKNARTIGVDWWPNEELSHSLAIKAISLYMTARPSVVVSHDCPKSIKDIILQKKGREGDSFNTFTQLMLEEMLQGHVPDVWYFGHHHINETIHFNGCRFVCVGINSIVHHR
jgi:predicted phosphodiesterase